MKRFLFIALLIAFPQNLYSQKTESIDPGVGLTANYGSGALGMGLEGWISEKNVIIPSVSFQYYDIDNRMVIDYGFGIAFRHNFSISDLRPFVTLGGNLVTRTFDEDTGKEDINYRGYLQASERSISCLINSAWDSRLELTIHTGRLQILKA